MPQDGGHSLQSLAAAAIRAASDMANALIAAPLSVVCHLTLAGIGAVEEAAELETMARAKRTASVFAVTR